MKYIESEVEIEILKEIEKIKGIKAVKKIEKVPIEYKRIAMFVALCSKNSQELKKMLRDLKEKPPELIIGELDKIIERFRKYIPIGEVEKKSFGEVFTPFTLVNEMLDTLPIEVWSNPNLKWADLCNGMGNFMIVIIQRLMIGLREWEPNEAKRYRHIIENMIYVAELQVKNMFLWMLSIDPKSKLTLNIYRGDSLHTDFDKHMKEVWKIEKFDIIVGNPPYQDSSISQGKNASFWTKFLFMCDKNLNKNGYLCYITPNSWIAPSETQKNKLKDIFFENDLLNLNMECSSYFEVGSTFSYYTIKKSNTKVETCINNNFKINLSKFPFLPNIINQATLSLAEKIFLKNNDKLNFSSSLRNHVFDENGEYYVYYGSDLKKSNILGKNFNIKKIVVNKPGYLKPVYDDGLYNTSGNNYWVEVNNSIEGDNLISFFNTKLAKAIFEKFFKYSGYNSLGILKNLPREIISDSWTDEKIYKYFDLSEEEIKLIEDTIK